MDPLSHAALGRCLAALVAGDRQVRGVAAAAVAGALIPDVDAVIAPFGWDRYLRVHEIGTHSALGTLGCAIVAAALVRRFARETAWGALIGAAWLGAASHPLLDVLSSARIRLLWPMVDHPFSVPAVAMADPYLATILVASLPVLWLVRRGRRRRVAAVVLGAAALFLAVKTAGATLAVNRYRKAAGPTTAFVVEAQWAALGEWRVFDRTSERVRAWRAGVSEAPRLLIDRPVEITPLADSTRTLSAVRNFLRVHQLAFAVTTHEPDGRARVLWSDLRFCWTEARPAAAPVGGSGLECALWVGAELDTAGRPAQQVVQIARWTQTRRVDD